jgi:undecaprenyl-diphosphatase
MAAGIAAFTVLWSGAGLVVTHTAIDRGDLHLSEWLVRHRTPVLDAVTWVGSGLANSLPVAVLWTVAVVVLAWWTRSWTAPLFICVAIGGEKLTYLLSSLVVGRDRPPVPPLGSVFASHSFPSGHAGAAVALYGGAALVVVARTGKPKGATGHGGGRGRLPAAVATGLAVVISLLVAFGRVYRGMHYTTDVVAGLLLGVTWLIVARTVTDRPGAREPAGRYGRQDSAGR